MNPMGVGRVSPGGYAGVPARRPSSYSADSLTGRINFGPGFQSGANAGRSGQLSQEFTDFAKRWNAGVALNQVYERQAAERRAADDRAARGQAATRWNWEKDRFKWSAQDRDYLAEDRRFAKQDRELAMQDRATAAEDRRRRQMFEDQDQNWQQEQRNWQRQMWDRARNAFSTGTGGGGGGGTISVGGSYGVNQS